MGGNAGAVGGRLAGDRRAVEGLGGGWESVGKVAVGRGRWGAVGGRAVVHPLPPKRKVCRAVLPCISTLD